MSTKPIFTKNTGKQHWNAISGHLFDKEKDQIELPCKPEETGFDKNYTFNNLYDFIRIKNYSKPAGI
jgi:hypothetical protein